VAKGANSVIEPGVDVAGDVALINSGQAQGGPNNTITVNGRTYGTHPNGRLYPIKGPGIHPLSRPAFKALGVFNKFGNSDRAAFVLNRMGVHLADRKAALQVWMLLQLP